jgi:VWFA-related protein
MLRWYRGAFGLEVAKISRMRVALVILMFACAASAQFRSTARLVVTPTTVTDSKGNYVDGLAPDDLILYDNNVRQTIQMDWMLFPIDVVVAVETSANSGAVIDKLGGSGILFTQLLAAEAGQTAMISFSEDVKLHQDFTGNPDLITHVLRDLRMEGGDGHILDALPRALAMLRERPAGRRRIVLMVAETRDRGSKAKLADVMERVQQLNATVYWLSYSHLLEPFTAKPKTMEDLKPEKEKDKLHPDDRGVPFDAGPGNPIYAIGELMRLKQPDLSELFTRATGGRTLNFLKKKALEDAIQLIGEEVHRQYILTFTPQAAETANFHSIRVEVKNRPELQVKTRAGYWPAN